MHGPTDDANWPDSCLPGSRLVRPCTPMLVLWEGRPPVQDFGDATPETEGNPRPGFRPPRTSWLGLFSPESRGVISRCPLAPRYMSGGKDSSAAGVGGGGSGGADPGVANGRSGMPGRGAGTRPAGPGGVIGSESFGPSRISPGEYVNTDVTAPAALVALALVYMR